MGAFIKNSGAHRRSMSVVGGSPARTDLGGLSPGAPASAGVLLAYRSRAP